MLRVSNSAHEPLHSPRTPKSPDADVLRNQIVGMLKDEQGKENDKPQTIPSPLIYQIKRKGAIESITQPDDKTERQIERIKRSHLRFIRESNITKSKVFPSIDKYVLHGESKETGRSTEIEDPSKRAWALPGDQQQDSKLKNVRFSIKEHKKDKQQEDLEQNDKEPNRVFCEVRGNAIQSQDISGKLLKPNLRLRKTEAAKRQATIHTSLQVFKRRLKLNHESYITPSVITNHDNDYIIRRVPFKNNQNPSFPMPRSSSAAKPVIEPRLSVATAPRPKSSIGPCLHVNQTLLKARPQSSPERQSYEGHLLRPRLSENVNNIDNALFQEEPEPETVANVVNTYFVEQSKPKPKQVYPSSLSTHNIDVHNSLTACPDARMKLTNCDHRFDNRFLRWLQESSANSDDARRASMRTHQEPPPKSPLLPSDHNDKEI